MQCNDCKYAKEPPMLDGAATGEVVICGLGAQFRATYFERNCSEFEPAKTKAPKQEGGAA